MKLLWWLLPRGSSLSILSANWPQRFLSHGNALYGGFGHRSNGLQGLQECMPVCC